jgi:hypothetical protein
MLKIMGHHAQLFAHIPDVPQLFAKEPDMRLIIRDWMDLTGQQFQEGRFPGAIGTEYGDVFTHLDGQREILEDTGIPPINRRPFDLD